MSDDPHGPAIAEHLRRQAAAVSDPPDPFAPNLAGIAASPEANAELLAIAEPVDLDEARARLAAAITADDPARLLSAYSPDPPSAPGPAARPATVAETAHAEAGKVHAELVDLLEDAHELAARLADALPHLAPTVTPWGAHLAEAAAVLPGTVRLALVIDPAAEEGAVHRLGEALRLAHIGDLSAHRDPATGRVTLELRP